MNPGKLNRRLTLQARSLTADAAGARVETWADAFECWGELVSQRQSEAAQSEAERNVETATFRIRHRAGLASGSHRLLYQLRFYDITGITEEGLKTTLLLDCRATQGLA